MPEVLDHAQDTINRVLGETNLIEGNLLPVVIMSKGKLRGGSRTCESQCAHVVVFVLGKNKVYDDYFIPTGSLVFQNMLESPFTLLFF
jgi:hypothetical protein